MDAANYWSRTLESRFSRRRALAVSGTAAGAAALLAACGGGGKSSGGATSGDKSGLVQQPVDTTKQAKRGGVRKWYVTADVVGLDPYFTAGASNIYSRMVYNRIWHFKPAILGTANYDVEGDLAESWEISPDKLQVTVKVRPNAITDARPPTNGRALDAQDIQYSWKEYSTRGSQASEMVDACGVLSMNATDARTVLIKLKAPSPGLFATASFIGSGRFNIVPREADGSFDIRREAHGAGYYQIGEYSPSNRFVYKRNPGYYRQSTGGALPFIDTIEAPIITDYAAGLAQFQAGGLYDFAVRPDDILNTKRQVPELKLYTIERTGESARYFFGQRPGPSSPFKDERLRQAFSMSLDRDLYIETLYNVSKFGSEGLPVDARWNSTVAYNHWVGWWLDPKGKDFGPNAKYLQRDLAEAKKLISAAGYPGGLEVEATYTDPPGSPNQRNFDILSGFALEARIKLKYNKVANPTPWRPNYYYARGDWDGMGFVTIRGAGDSAVAMSSYYHPTGGIFPGFDPDGRSTYAGDPYVTDIIEKMNLEFDQQKRYALAHEFQQYDAKKQYFPSFPGGASSFALAWPVLQNYQVYRQVESSSEDEMYLWLDETQAPVKKA